MEYENRIIQKLQNYPENDLTKDLIIPLFEKMGYLKVEFFGGQSEEGKDIVIWDENKLGDIELTVAQVKHFKFTNRASDSKSLQTVINQLIMCITKKLIYTDKSSHYPSKVLLITTYRIETKSLLTRFDNDPYLKDNKIRIIDGVELTKLIIKYLPDHVKKLVGFEYAITKTLSQKFSNELLLKALGRRSGKEIKNVYTDIDLSLGKLSTKLFFNSLLRPKKETVELTKMQWESFKNICVKLENEFTLDFLDKSIIELEVVYQGITSNYNHLNQQASKLKVKVESDKNSIDSIQKDRNAQSRVLADIQDGIKNNKETYNSEIRDTKLSDFEKNKRKEIRKKELKSERIKESKERKKLNDYKHKIELLEKSIYLNESKISKLNDEKSKLLYSVEIDGVILVAQIEEKRKWIEQMVDAFNNNKHTEITLKDFFRRCDLIFELVSILFDKRNIAFNRCIGFDENNRIRTDFETTRLKLDLDKIFDTGLSLSLLGEAGAGKSTSLEMYAWNRRNSNKVIIPIPLGYVFQENTLVKDSDPVVRFEKSLVKYLNILEIPITLSEFQNILQKYNAVLLLDGLDEAIKVYPELPSTIKRISEKYLDVQIILSSRMHGSYLNEIPFFTVTLLPFTIDQRDLFISKWFENDANSEEIVSKIYNHLSENSSVNEIICTPLLTTTLCVLAEHNLTLPRTELKLYDERLRLFTGYYDNVKHISTRITATPNTLEIIAQKLAFYLHSKNKREEKLDVLKEVVRRQLINQFEEESIKKAFDELMYPCEILIPMSADGKYGFGHLRYQEHLVAREFQKRSVRILSYLKQEWWEGPLILFVRMNEDIEWLIREIGENNYIDLPIVQRMINTRTRIEKERLNSLVEQYVLLKTNDWSRL